MRIVGALPVLFLCFQNITRLARLWKIALCVAVLAASCHTLSVDSTADVNKIIINIAPFEAHHFSSPQTRKNIKAVGVNQTVLTDSTVVKHLRMCEKNIE